MSEDTVVRETRIQSIDDYMNANAKLAEEVCNDSALATKIKVELLSKTIQNQCRLSNDQQARLKTAQRLGIKANGKLGELPFNSTE